MTMKSGAKFEEKLTIDSKNDMRNLAHFNASSSKSENLHFSQQHMKFQLKIAKELSFMTLKNDPKFEEKLTFCLQNDIRNLVSFNTSKG